MSYPSGSKAVTVGSSCSMFELDSPVSAGPLRVLRLAEDLREALELQASPEEWDGLRAQLPPQTAQALLEWLQSGTVSTHFLLFQHLPMFEKKNTG